MVLQNVSPFKRVSRKIAIIRVTYHHLAELTNKHSNRRTSKQAKTHTQTLPALVCERKSISIWWFTLWAYSTDFNSHTDKSEWKKKKWNTNSCWFFAHLFTHSLSFESKSFEFSEWKKSYTEKQLSQQNISSSTL